ncbi:MAG: S8 family serine peptidase [Bacteroidota bacterium]
MYTLHRSGEKIQIEKEPEYFTAILPNQHLIQEVNKLNEVANVKKVFRNVYKIKSSETERDDLMTYLRSKHNSQAVYHHSYNPIGDKITRYYLTDQIIVRFVPSTSSTAIESIMQSFGIRMVKSYNALPDTYLFQVTSSAGKNPVKLSAELYEHQAILLAEPNLINRFDRAYMPSDELFSNQWHLHSQAGIELVAEASVEAPAAWDISRGDRQVVVAVIDDGFDLYHPDLQGDGNKIVFPKDYIDGDTRPFPVRAHGDFHGTPCAGVAIGEENGSGIVGIAPQCSFMPIRFDLRADDNLLWEIFDYAGKHADILSCSWGPVPVYAPLHTILYEKFSELAKTGGPGGNGCAIFFAAGNFNAPIKDMVNPGGFQWRHPRYGLRTTRTAILNGNCAHPDVIAVSASTSQNRKAAYSNWGKEISICAPSNNWNPINSNAYAPGRGIWTTDNENFGLGYERDSRYTSDFGGTSSATPLAAGIAALLRSVNPALTPKQIETILRETADKIVDDQPDPVLGQQRGSYDAGGHSEWFGYGKVNAAKAVQKAKELATPVSEEPVEPTPVEPEVPETQLVEGLFIVAALVNPAGKEAGAEHLTLFNSSPKELRLDGWVLSNDKQRKQSLDGLSIAAGDHLKIMMTSRLRLANRGATLMLLDAEGREVHRVRYTAAEARREGWSIRF